MRNNKFLVLGALLLFAGCAKDFQELQVPEGMIPLNISGSIDQVPVKATAEGFNDQDEIGLYAVNWTESNTVPGILQNTGNQADNVKYTFDKTNYKWVPSKAVYYKDVNTNADLYLYYPYQQSVADVHGFNFEVKKDQSKAATATELCGYEASDFLWGKAENVQPTEASIGVSLHHRLSAVNVILKEKDGGKEVSGFEPGEFAELEKGVIHFGTLANFRGIM